MLSVYKASVEVEVRAVHYRPVESVNSSTLTSAWLHIQMLLHSRGRRAELSIIPTAANSEKPETYQVEQVWKLFLACLYDSYLILDPEIPSVDQHVVKPEYT